MNSGNPSKPSPGASSGTGSKPTLAKSNAKPAEKSNFLHQIIASDVKNKVNDGKVVTRFPPEPNGYLHIGHAKALCLNFGFASEFQGKCHLRFDDTNPETEDPEFIESIQADIRWLGFDWGKDLYFASDYFEQLYQWAEHLIQSEKAFVCSLSEEDLRAYRGDFTTPGRPSPYRSRSVAENLDLFRRMRAGEFSEGAHTLRAKIDFNSPNMNLRDPLLYRIRKTPHYRTASNWCIYPMYDYAHPLSDAIEGITHSLCSLEYQDHRPFYDWCIENCPVPAKPRQYEFARLSMTYWVMSKRLLRHLVEAKLVFGWDDPRMPTISGLRRRGYLPETIREFAERIGISKAESTIEMDVLEDCARDTLDVVARRAMVVLKPIRVVIENLQAGESVKIETAVHPKKPELGLRTLYFRREIWIDQDDFHENPPADYFRLKPGGEVRLRNAFVVRVREVVKDSSGKVVELRCEYDPVTLGGKPPSDGRKVKGIIHWVSAEDAISAEVRLFGRLFSVPNPNEVSAGKDFTEHLDPKSLEVITDAKLEPSLLNAEFEERFQFERVGYFGLDIKDSVVGKKLVFNRVVSLKT